MHTLTLTFNIQWEADQDLKPNKLVAYFNTNQGQAL